MVTKVINSHFISGHRLMNPYVMVLNMFYFTSALSHIPVSAQNNYIHKKLVETVSKRYRSM